MWFDYQLKIADVYSTYIGNVKKLVLSSFYKEEYAHHYKNLPVYLKLGLNIKKYIVY